MNLLFLLSKENHNLMNLNDLPRVFLCSCNILVHFKFREIQIEIQMILNKLHASSMIP